MHQEGTAPGEALAGTPGRGTDHINGVGRIPTLAEPVKDSRIESFLDALPVPVAEILRVYQRQQLAEMVEAIRAKFRGIALQAPTGSGKTHEIAAICAAAEAAGLRVLVLATRTRLVRQIHERLEEFGVGHGVIASALRGMTDLFQPVQVAAADTLYRRAMVSQTLMLPPADIIIFDECHLAAARTRLALIEQYPHALLIGFSATPARRSGKALSNVFDKLILGPTIAELISLGMLVKPRIFSIPVATKEQLDALPKDMERDYQTKALGDLMSTLKLVGDILQNWLRIAHGLRTIIFCVNKKHGAALLNEFQRAGVAAEMLSDDDDEETREQVMGRLESGQTTVVFNCFLMAYGVDIPTVECIVLARPTRSLAMYLQMVGRGLRPAPGKQHCILIDHGRVVENLGLPTGDFAWTLDDHSNVNDEARCTQGRKDGEEKPRKCDECSHVWLVSEDGNSCPLCGWAPKVAAKAIAVREANLVELDEATPEQITVHSPEAQRFFQEALQNGINRNPQKWKDTPNKVRAAAFHAMRERFDLPEGVKIPSRYWSLQPIETTPQTAGWLMHKRIKYARTQERFAS